MKVVMEISGTAETGFVTRIVEQNATDAADERLCRHVAAIVEKAVHLENADLDGTE